MSRFSKVIATTIAVQYVVTTSALAWPATTTTNVNMRSGPGTGNAVIRTLSKGEAVEVADCDEAASWCAVEVNGQSGFVSGQYLEPTEEIAAWPRGYVTDSGAVIILHQPQITEWEDFRVATGMIATEYKKEEKAESEFGVIEIKADTHVDKTEDSVVVSNLKVTKLTFSTLDRDQLSEVALRLGEAVPTEPVTMSFSRMAASLEGFVKAGEDVDLKAEAPPILVSEQPAILVQTNGEAVTGPVDDSLPELSFVINSNWDILKTEDTGTWYLRVEKSWMQSAELASGWQAAEALPAAFKKLPGDDDNWTDARAAVPAQPFEKGAPKVFYSDTPAELIQTDGPPKLEAVADTGLQWVSNSESDLFFYDTDKKWYFLTSGRWFRAGSLEGPWDFASTDLPEAFLNIPEGAEYSSVRASIPGTSESAEARLRASIPELARVEIGSVKVDVSYGGDPEFKPIEGTSVSYAANASETVIQVGGKYYVVKDGIWFVGDSPKGPFEVATSVPDEVYKIPPSSPVYNVTYVRVYESSPSHVWCGYTSGYLWGFLAWGAIAYGTGWYYRPYWYNRPGWRYPIYYPRPVHYGMGAYYNPIRGTFGRYGYAYGPYRGIGVGARYNPRTGRYVRAGRVTTPRGSRGFVSAYNPRTGTRAAARGGSNIYGSWGSAGVRRGSDWARAQGVSGNRGGGAMRWNTSAGDQGAVIRGRGGDLYAGRNGNVYRRQDGQWQKRGDGGWSDVNRPGTRDGKAGNNRKREQKQARRTDGNRQKPKAQQRQQRQKTQQRQARKQPTQKRQQPRAQQRQRKAQPRSNYNNLNRHHRNRQYGNQRTVRNHNYSRGNRSMSHRSRGGGRGGRGGRGGGRRR